MRVWIFGALIAGLVGTAGGALGWVLPSLIPAGAVIGWLLAARLKSTDPKAFANLGQNRL